MPQGMECFDAEYAYRQLTEGMKSLGLRGTRDTLDTTHGHGAFEPARNESQEPLSSAAMAVDNDTENKANIAVNIHEVALNGMEVECDYDAQSGTQLDAKIPYSYFIRISPVSLNASAVQPTFDAEDNFQLVVWKSPEGRTTARLSYGPFSTLIDPQNETVYIIEYLKHYLTEMCGKDLFLYIRRPYTYVQLEEMEEHILGMCAVLHEFRGSFQVVDVAFTLW